MRISGQSLPNIILAIYDAKMGFRRCERTARDDTGQGLP